MKRKTLSFSTLMARAALIAALYFIGTAGARAQIYPGDNAVYNTAITNSHSFIDASVFTTGDICAQINSALKDLANTVTYPNYGGAGVIDARGIKPGTSACTASPWAGLTTYPPAVVLLPAGTIIISSTWVLPDRTRIIGEGSGANGTSVTTIQAASTGFTGTAMIQMGANLGTGYLCPTSTGNICSGVGVEDLRLDGDNVSGLNGIFNPASQELSYVNRVDLYRITGTGILIGAYNTSTNTTLNAGAQNSGPYSNIRFENTTSVSSTTQCVQIIGYGTRGVHGLTCTAGGASTPEAAVVLDALNNTIEDVFIKGFTDGILLGANDAQLGVFESGNILLNVGGVPVTNLIHICNPKGTSTGTNCVTGTLPVTDLSILAATNQGGSSTATIRDDQLNTGLLASQDSSVGAYIIGEQATTTSSSTFPAGYSRFSTSPRVPTWAVGTGTPTSSTCTTGSLYSNTNGGPASSKNTFYACAGSSGWTGIQ